MTLRHNVCVRVVDIRMHLYMLKQVKQSNKPSD